VSTVNLLDAADLRDVLRLELERVLLNQRSAGGYLSLKSAANYLDVSEQALRARVKRQEIPVHRRDGRLYFERKALDEYVRGGV